MLMGLECSLLELELITKRTLFWVCPFTQAMFTPNRYLNTLKYQFLNPTFHSSISPFHNPSSTNPALYNPAIEFVLNEARQFQSSEAQFNSPARNEEEELSSSKPKTSDYRVSHPWPEWSDLMKKLLKNGYFDETGNPFNGELGTKEANYIRTACLNFSRDQYQLIRYLSQKDILAIVEHGCPTTDKKVVNSGKRIRALVGIDEGNVCSSCILRGDCERAYVKARESEGGRTVDVMRLLVVYSLDPVLGSVQNTTYVNKKVTESVRTLLKEIVHNTVEGQDVEPPKDWKLSEGNNNGNSERSRINNVPMKQGDWVCPKCNFLNFARNIKCLRCDALCEEKARKLAEELEHLPMKKGDWICEKCKFVNFARNTRCLQCREKPPKRLLNPGEWECDSCNYINFRRNMVCLKCDHKRPIASKTSNFTCPSQNNNPRLVREDRRSMYGSYNDSLKFVEDVRNECSGPSSWDEGSGFVDFPINGGKSGLSRNAQRQERWKMEMENQNRSGSRETTDCIPEKIKFLTDDDDDDEMAEWFEGVKKT